MPLRSRSAIARLAVVAGVLLIAGCAENNRALTTPAPISVQPPPKRIQVQLASFDHDLYFARGAKALTPAQTTELMNFLSASGIGEGDAVTVEGSGRSSLTATRQAAVISELRQLRIDAVSGTDRKLTAESVRVHADRAVATAPACPDWSKPEADEPNNLTSSNYGCATESNLAAMIVNPADLVKPKAGGAGDGFVLAKGVELYRSGNLSKTIGANSGYSSGGLSGASGSSSGGGSSGGGGSGGSGQ
ncbi:MAG TPA: CpaD family pilus assembly lipoprotein [Alphaproteobacteria bacterium]|jgi:pilus assembly protein CpaD|nr:CpaD family pilus assembly lipoprotein [Alphaproteobacteria bacterium]